jgi:hypothetical protein
MGFEEHVVNISGAALPGFMITMFPGLETNKPLSHICTPMLGMI